MQSKICSKCRGEKPADAFSPHTKTKSGLSSWCRACAQEHYHAKKFDPAWLESERARNRSRMQQRTRAQKDKANAASAARRKEKPLSEAQLAAARAKTAAWKLANPDKWNAYCAKRRADRIQATPRWADLEEIEKIYSLAQSLSAWTCTEHHVDHIVPLNSEIVCGLHVACNLRVVPWAENLSKGNRHWPDMP